MLLKMLLSFLLLFVFLPMIVIRFYKEDKSWIDRLFICLIHSSLFFILVIHLLALIKLYEIITLILACLLAVFIIYRVYKSDQSISKGTMMLVTALELLDDRKELKQSLHHIKASIIQSIKQSWRRFIDSLQKHWFIWISIIATLAYAAYTRFKHSVINLYYGSSDPYVHMEFSKQLMRNEIFKDGVYPQGFSSIISSLSVFFNMDAYIIVRFIGPLGGMLMVLSIYYAVRKIVGVHYPIIFFSVFVYVVYAGFPTYLWRQISALSMEYAVIFLLPGIALLIEYFRKRQRVHLMLAAECLALTVIIHPFTAVTLGGAHLIVCVSYWRTMILPGVAKRFLSYMVIAGFIGVLPLIIAFLTAPVGGFGYITDSVKIPMQIDFSQWPNIFWSGNTFVIYIFIGSFLVLLYKAYAIWKNRRGNIQDDRDDQADPAIASMIFIFFAFYVMYRSGAYGLKVLIPADRVGVFFSLICAVVSGLLLKYIFSDILIFRYRIVVRNAIILVIAAVVLYSGNIHSAPKGDRYQYNDNIEVYLKIKEEFDPKLWTIISTQEENPFVKGYGYHHQLWEFANSISRPSNDRFVIENKDLFIFVEKIPLGSQTEVTKEEAMAPFPQFSGSDTTQFYYRRLENRRILQSKVYYWAEDFMKKHDKMTIYYDSPVLRVYRFYQADPMNRPVNLRL